MNASAARVLAELGRLAEERGWGPVSATIEAIHSSDPRRVLLATPSGMDPTLFQRWIDRIASGTDVKAVSLESLEENPLPALTSGRVVALLECGRLLEAQAVAALSVAVLSRPRPSYAIVLSGAERIGDAEELDLVERGARRILDGDYGGARAASLLDERAYLWAAASSAFLAKRLAADGDKLASWLTEAPADSVELLRACLIYAVNLADEQTATTEFSQRDAEVREQRIRHVRDSLAELRRRLLRRLEAESGLIQRQLNASLQTLEQDLLGGLRPYLESRLSVLAPRADVDFLRSLVVDYLRAGTRAWQDRTLPSLTAQSLDTLSNTRTLLDGIDWQLVNEVVIGKGGQRTYPEALVSQLAAEASVTLPDGDLAEEVDALQLNRQTVTLADAVRVAFAGSAVVATAWYLTGAQAVAIVAAGASAVVASGLFNVRLHREQLLAELEPWARSEIKTVVRHAADKVQERAPRSIEAMGARLDGELRELEAVLDDALARLRARSMPAPTGDRESIEELRQAAIALADENPS